MTVDLAARAAELEAARVPFAHATVVRAQHPTSAHAGDTAIVHPDGTIDGFVGGIMGSYRSPRDPVFWTHHNMIECLWVNWNLLRGNPNTNEAAWMDHQFTEFADEDGNPVTVNVATSLLYGVSVQRLTGRAVLGVAASLVPARRATGVDRMLALRSD